MTYNFKFQKLFKIEHISFALFLIISIFLSIKLNIWNDEAYSLHTTSNNPISAFIRSIEFEENPPLYYFFLSIWRMLNPSIFFARLFSVFCIMLSLLLFKYYLNDKFRSYERAIALYIFGFNPFVLWAATEIRLYACSILIATAFLKFFYEFDSEKYTTKKLPATHIILCALAPYFNYLLIIIPLTYLSTLFYFSRKNFYRLIFILLISYSPLIPLVHYQSMQSDPILFNNDRHLLSALHHIARNQVLFSIIPNIPNFAFVKALKYTLIFIFIVLSLNLFIRRRRNLKSFFIHLYQIFAFVLFFWIICIMFLKNYYLDVRHTIFIIPIVLSLIFLLIRQINSPKFRIITLSTYAVIISISTMYQFYPLSKRGDWINVSNFIHKNEKNGEPILVFLSEAILPLSHYYKGINELTPIPMPFDTSHFSMKQAAIKDNEEIDRFFSNIDADTMWLICEDIEEYFGIKFNRDILISYVKNHFYIAIQKKFYQVSVFYLSRQAPLSDSFLERRDEETRSRFLDAAPDNAR